MTLLTVLGAWFLAGLVATLVLGPRLRRAAEQAGPAIEPEPLYGADRSPLRWRLGTLGVIGLLAGSTGMAAAGALPGTTQTIAHHVLGTVGFDVPKAADAPAQVATGPAQTPWSEEGRSSSSPDDAAGGTEQGGPAETGPPPSVEDGEAAVGDGDDAPDGGGTSDVPSVDGEDVEAGDAEPAGDPAPATEPSDVEEGGTTTTEPTDVPPPDPPAEEPPPTATTTPPPPGEPPPTTTTTTTTPPPEEPPPTTTTTTLPAPPPPEPPPGS